MPLSVRNGYLPDASSPFLPSSRLLVDFFL